MKIYRRKHSTDCFSSKNGKEFSFKFTDDDLNIIIEADTSDFDIFIAYNFDTEGDDCANYNVLGVYPTFEEALIQQRDNKVAGYYAFVKIALLKWGQPLEEAPTFIR
jgi:hypothetical protein